MRSNPPGAGLGLAEGKRGRARAQGGRWGAVSDRGRPHQQEGQLVGTGCFTNDEGAHPSNELRGQNYNCGRYTAGF